MDAVRRSPTLTRDVLARLPARKSVRILDAGCGQGDLIALIRDQGWTNVSGFDISEEQVATASRLGVDGVTHDDLYAFSAAHPAAYDVVLAIDLVEHFDRADVLPLFAALRSLLAPGGRLIMQTPNGASPFSGRIYWSDITHGMQYTGRSLSQVCAAVGFASVDTFSQRPACHGIISGLRAVTWRFVEAYLWVGTVAVSGSLSGHVLTPNLVAIAINDAEL